MSRRLTAWVPRLEAVALLGLSESTFGRYQRAGLVDWERDAEDGTVRIEVRSLERLREALATVIEERTPSHLKLQRLAELTGRPIPADAKLSEV